MPGFHEHYEEHKSFDQIQHGHESIQERTSDEILSKPLVPHSEGIPNAPSTLPIRASNLPTLEKSDSGVARTSSKKKKQASSKGSTSLIAQVDIESHDCPVCGKTFQTDNQGLNSHIDFCLSRGAIQQAHAEASSPVKKHSLILKPISKGKNRT